MAQIWVRRAEEGPSSGIAAVWEEVRDAREAEAGADDL